MATTPRDPIKVYDARWEADEFSDAEVRRLFEATFLYAHELGVSAVTFGRDARLAAGRVMGIGVDVALSAGLKVYVNPSPISTPQSYFQSLHFSRENRGTMGLTVTASHNPAQYVGVKFVVPVVHAIGYDCGPLGGLTRVRELYHSSAKLPAGRGELTLINLAEEYVSYSLRAAGVAGGSLAGLRVVLDTFNGSAGPEIYAALTRAGATVYPLRLIPDGTFPTGSPNPTSTGKMDAAIALAKQVDAHLVLGIDGDGDRIVFGSPRGVLTAGFAFVPILRSCLATAGDTCCGRGRCKEGHGKTETTVLYDPKVSPLALAEWGRLGVRPVLFRNGHSQIKDYMTGTCALAAAEESGHYYHRLKLGDVVVSGENSILTVLLMAKSLQADPKLMDGLWKLQDQVFTTGEFNYQFADDATRDAALKAIVNRCIDDGCAVATTTADGIDLQGTCVNKGVVLDPGKVKLADGWYSGYFRVATNEKGVVRSYLSAGDASFGGAKEKSIRDLLEGEFGGRRIE